MKSGTNQILKIADLSKYFGGLGAVVDLNLNVRKGEILGLIGPNGAGKSTLLNMIGGTLSATRGRLIYKTEDVTRLSAHQMAGKGVARVFQSNTLFEEMEVIKNVRVGLHLHTQIGFWGGFLGTAFTKKRERQLDCEAADILKFVGLSSQTDHLAANLPHGSRRILCLAIAMAVKPDLLLLDEPLTGMNAEEVNNMIALIDALKQDKGITSIIVEHNMRAVMGLCDRIAVLNYGKKIAEGSPEEIGRNPAVIEAYLGVDQDVA